MIYSKQIGFYNNISREDIVLKIKVYKNKLFLLGLTALIFTKPIETMALSSKILFTKSNMVNNNSNREINLKDYKIYYNYPDKGDESDVLWVDINEDINIKSGETIVFWIKNGSNDTLTDDDFNKNFNTKLEIDVNLFEVYSAGMANSGARALRLTTSTK